MRHVEDRIGGSDAVQGATYGAAAGFCEKCGLSVVIPNFLPRNSASLAHGSEAGLVGWGGAPLYG